MLFTSHLGWSSCWSSALILPLVHSHLYTPVRFLFPSVSSYQTSCSPNYLQNHVQIISDVISKDFNLALNYSSSLFHHYILFLTVPFGHYSWPIQEESRLCPFIQRDLIVWYVLFPQLQLCLWFSAGGNFATKGASGNIRRQFWLSQLG